MTVDNSLNLYFFIINYSIILRQQISSFFKLSQLITFSSGKKSIYEILCVIKQHADSTWLKQAKFHKSVFYSVWGQWRYEGTIAGGGGGMRV